MNKRILLGIATLLAALLYACPADGGSTGGPAPQLNIEEEITQKDPALVYKVDMHKDAQTLFSRGDVDNPYLFSLKVTSVKNLEAMTGEITIVGGDAVLYEETKGAVNPFEFDLHTDLQTYKTTKGMYTLDANTFSGVASIDEITDNPAYDGTTYIVGIGPAEDKPIDFDALTDDFSVHVKILYEGEVLKEETAQVSKADRYDVTTWRDLQHIEDDLKGSYEVKNDIIFPELGAYGYENFRPIGYGYSTSVDEKWLGPPTFEGIFKGNNHKIEGLYVNRGAETPVGLFGNVRGGTIQDITIYHRGMYSGGVRTGVVGAGGLVGILEEESTIKNCHVYSMNGEAIVSRRAGVGVGGLVGHMDDEKVFEYDTDPNRKGSTVSDSSAHTNVVGVDGIGGLIGVVGHTNQHTVLRSYATGNVEGQVNTGALIGQVMSARVKVEQVYATGNVVGNKRVGGLIGYVGSDANSFSGHIYITGYATGDVLGSKNVGGLIGMLSGGQPTLIGYATGTVKGQSKVGGVVGEQTWKWQSQSSRFGAVIVRQPGGWDTVERNVIMSVYSIGDVIGDESVGGIFGYLDATRIYQVDGRLVYTGYARGAITSEDTSAGLFVGEFKRRERGRDVNAYVSSTTSKFTNVKENQVTGLNGNGITISEVSDSNYKNKFKDFVFGNEVGQWAWEGNGKWPALNMGGKTPMADQPIAPSSYIPAQTQVQETQSDKTMEGIERLKDNVFKVYETRSWEFEKKRIENVIPQADFYPTGLYIKPNQTITVTVDSDTAPKNLTLLAGTYSRYEGESWNPDVFTLKVGKNTITNPRNTPRLIYIQFVELRRLFDVATVTIHGATKLPYFIRGKTTSQEFQSMLKNYDYDSVLIASNRIMMVASKKTALQVRTQDWGKTADLLDKAVETAEYVHGLDSETYYDTPPTTRILAVERSGGGPMSATHYRISTPKESAIGWIDNSKIIQDWGLWREIGHMYEPRQILINGTTVNIYSLAIGRAFNQKSRLVQDGKWNEIKNGIKAYLAKPAAEKNFNDLDVFIKLGMFQQLWLGYGSTDKARDKFFINLNKKIRQESEYIPPGGDQALSYLILKASEVYGYNLNEFFRKWGIQLWKSEFVAVDRLGLKPPPVDPSTLSE